MKEFVSQRSYINIIAIWLIRMLKTKKKSGSTTVLTFPMGLCFNDLTDASWTHSVLGCQGEFVPCATLQILQTV
ncbi:hypothetical protein GOODEAATRI_026286 [Goodea atripinnis]|uniref:Uncharacterized protein n=1 Tax=Goodea atripinnis TaxID=208336 RepID=A0ABV0NDT1_9TELE